MRRLFAKVPVCSHYQAQVSEFPSLFTSLLLQKQPSTSFFLSHNNLLVFVLSPHCLVSSDAVQNDVGFEIVGSVAALEVGVPHF